MAAKASVGHVQCDVEEAKANEVSGAYMQSSSLLCFAYPSPPPFFFPFL